MDRDTLNFVVVGGIGVALVLYLAGAILNDLGLFPFYANAPRSDSPMLYVLYMLAFCLLLFLPAGFFLEKHMMHHQPAKRNRRTIPIPSNDSSIKGWIWRSVDRDEENHTRSEHT
jgi:hypothetical protein